MIAQIYDQCGVIIMMLFWNIWFVLSYLYSFFFVFGPFCSASMRLYASSFTPLGLVHFLPLYKPYFELIFFVNLSTCA